jgi:hypothetical protein
LSLTFPIALFLGVWQYGYSFYVYAELEQAVRDGARYAAARTYDSATSTPTDTFLAAFRTSWYYDPEPARPHRRAPLLSTQPWSSFSHLPAPSGESDTAAVNSNVNLQRFLEALDRLRSLLEF